MHICGSDVAVVSGLKDYFETILSYDNVLQLNMGLTYVRIFATLINVVLESLTTRRPTSELVLSRFAIECRLHCQTRDCTSLYRVRDVHCMHCQAVQCRSYGRKGATVARALP